MLQGEAVLPIRLGLLLKTKMSEKLANTLALKSTEIFCSYLKDINKKLYLTTNKHFKENSLNVWLPSVILSNENRLKKTGIPPLIQ